MFFTLVRFDFGRFVHLYNVRTLSRYVSCGIVPISLSCGIYTSNHVFKLTQLTAVTCIANSKSFLVAIICCIVVGYNGIDGG